MASISSVGVGSGVLNNDLIDQLIEAERSPTDKRLEVEKTDLDLKISELGNVRSAVSSLESAVGSLTLASSFETNTTSSSDSDKLTATASSLAKPGVYDIETLALARSQTLASKSYDSINEVVGQGNLVFNFGEVQTSLNADKSVSSFDNFSEDPAKASKTISINSSNHTLAGVRDAVNAADIGITASIVDTGDGFRLLFESSKTGTENGFTITAQGASNGLDDFNFNASDNDQVLHTTDAVDARLKINGLEVSRESNQVTGVINGLTLNLRQTSIGEPVSLTVSADMETINKRMQDFVGAYNELKTLTNTLTAYDLDSQKGSVFTGDSTIRNLDTQLKRILSSSLPVGAQGDINSLAEIGIKTNEKTGIISFDSSKFSSYAKTNPEALTKLFGTSGIGANNVDYIRGNNQTQSGDYEVVVTQLATQGEFVGNSTAGGPYIINALNDDLRVSVDGLTTEPIALNQGSYSGEELATLLQTQINADERLIQNAKSVAVEFDSSDNSFTITSASFGSKSSVAFSSIDSETADTLGLYRQGQGPRDLAQISALKTNGELASSFTVDDSNDEFSLSVGGTNSGNISISQGSYSSGNDLASALQTAINSDSNLVGAGLNATVSYIGEQNQGRFEIKFNNNESYSISSADGGLADIGIVANMASTSETSALAAGDDFGSAITVDANNDTFSLNVDGQSFTDLQIAQGSYSNGASLAAAIETAINAQTNVAAAAVTAAGSLDLSTPIDFSSANRSFSIALDGGAAQEIVVNQNATVDLTGDSNVDAQDNLKAIQDALDATLGAGQVSASLDGDGLVLTSASTGAAASIQISSDGRAARTAAGSVDTSAFNDLTDFSAASIDFDLNGTAVSVDLSTISVPASGPATLVADIQAQVDAGLVSAGLSAGEIVVAQDSSNRIYFSGNTIAAGESLSITASSNNVLGLSTAGAIAGLDGFGLAQATSSGEDANAATVSFVGGNENGGFNIDLGNGSTFTISAAEDNMASSLGIAVSDGSQNLVKTGQDVAGTINGVAAVGSGQRLTGPEDNDAYGLALNITGDALGKRGSVNFTLGLAEQTQRFLEDLLGANGLLGAKESGFQDSLKEIAKEKADLETRMEGRRASLSRQFTYYDTIVAQLNSSLDFIKANFKALNAANN